MKNIYIGCDIAKSKIDFCILSDDKEKDNSFYGQFSNSPSGFDTFIKTIAVNYPFVNPIIGFESTGSYGFAFAKFLSDNAILNKMFNAKKVSKYLKSMTIQGKTDKSDSYAIAHFSSIQNLNIFQTNYSSAKELFIKYTTSLRMYQKIKTQIINMSKSTGYGVESDSLHIELMKTKTELKNREKNIKEDAIVLLRELYPIVDIIEKKYKSLGFSLLLILIPKIYDDIEKYSINQTVAFLGFNPVSFQSGQMKLKDKLNIFGDKELKRLLYLSSVRSIQFNPILKEKYQKLLLRNKPKKLALTIISRKILVLIIKDIKAYKVLHD